MDNRCSMSFFCGMMFGAFFGAAAALLLAPQSGAETRSMIADKSKEYYDEGKRKIDEFSENLPDMIEDAKVKIKETADTAIKNLREKTEDFRAKVAARKPQQSEDEETEEEQA